MPKWPSKRWIMDYTNFKNGKLIPAERIVVKDKKIISSKYKVDYSNYSENNTWKLREKILEIISNNLDKGSKNSFIPLNVITTKNNEADVDRIFNKFQIRNVFWDWYRDKTNYYILFLDELNFKLEKSEVAKVLSKFNANYLNKTPKKNSLVKTRNIKTPELVVEGGIGILFIDGDKIQIGPANNSPLKLLKIMYPFGKSVAINAVYNASTTIRSKNKNVSLSLLEKKEKLRMRIKDLQSIFNGNKKIKTKLKLKFNDNDETVFLNIS